MRVQVHFLRQFDPAAQYRLLTKYALQTSCGTAGLSDDRCRVSKGPASGNGIEYEITLYFRIDAEPPSAPALKTNLEAAYASHRAPAALYGVPQCEVVVHSPAGSAAAPAGMAADLSTNPHANDGFYTSLLMGVFGTVNILLLAWLGWLSTVQWRLSETALLRDAEKKGSPIPVRHGAAATPRPHRRAIPSARERCDMQASGARCGLQVTGTKGFMQDNGMPVPSGEPMCASPVYCLACCCCMHAAPPRIAVACEEVVVLAFACAFCV